MFESFLGVNPWTALFILLNTLTIYFVAKKFLFVPVMNMIESRQKEIDDMYANADLAQSNAQAMEAEYRQKLAEVLKQQAKPGDVLLVKGSRGMRMELALEQFLKEEK